VLSLSFFLSRTADILADVFRVGVAVATTATAATRGSVGMVRHPKCILQRNFVEAPVCSQTEVHY